MANISPAAHIAKTARIGENVSIGPGCIIEDDVIIGDGCELRGNVLVCSGTTLGKNNRMFQGAVLGEEPQNVGEVAPKTRLLIGDNNTFREYITIHRGSPGGVGQTTIGNNNFIMGFTHIAHDCILGDNIVITNSCNIAGHVQLENNIWLAGVCGIHQFTTVGRFAYLAGGSNPSQDVPPFLKSAGQTRCCPRAVNSVGLARNGFSQESIKSIKDIFRRLYIRKESASIEAQVKDMLLCDQLDDNARYLLEFLGKSFASPKRRFKELNRKH